MIMNMNKNWFISNAIQKQKTEPIYFIERSSLMTWIKLLI